MSMITEQKYNMPPKDLFGKRCRIKHTSGKELKQELK